MAGDNEQVILEGAMESLCRAVRRIGAVPDRMRATGTRQDSSHHDLAHRVAPAPAMTAAGMESRVS